MRQAVGATTGGKAPRIEVDLIFVGKIVLVRRTARTGRGGGRTLMTARAPAGATRSTRSQRDARDGDKYDGCDTPKRLTLSEFIHPHDLTSPVD
jgi:hypothetical protein